MRHAAGGRQAGRATVGLHVERIADAGVRRCRIVAPRLTEQVGERRDVGVGGVDGGRSTLQLEIIVRSGTDQRARTTEDLIRAGDVDEVRVAGLAAVDVLAARRLPVGERRLGDALPDASVAGVASAPW